MISKYTIEHMEWQLLYDQKDGGWFSVHVPGEKRALFSGAIHPGVTSEQVRQMLHGIMNIEKKIKNSCENCNGTGWIEVEDMVRVRGEYQAYEPVGRDERCEYCNPLGV